MSAHYTLGVTILKVAVEMRAQILELKHKLFQTTKLPSDYQRLLQYFCKSCQLQFLWNENETTGQPPLHFVKWIIERLRVNGPLIREERLLSLPPPHQLSPPYPLQVILTKLWLSHCYLQPAATKEEHPHQDTNLHTDLILSLLMTRPCKIAFYLEG